MCKSKRFVLGNDNLAKMGGALPGEGVLRYRGRPHPHYIFRRRRGSFLRSPHVCDFVKEGYFFVPRYELWGIKIPLRNICGSDAGWLPKWLGFRVCSSTILNLTYASDVVIVNVYVWTTESAAAEQAEDYEILSWNMCFQFHPISVFW